jgi:hypothetical protein
MVRLSGIGGAVQVDFDRGAFGRGHWLHPRLACVTQVSRRGARGALKPSAAQLVSALQRAGQLEALRQLRRVVARLASAPGQPPVAQVGLGALGQVPPARPIELALVAVDLDAADLAGETATGLQALLAAGRVRYWPDRALYGRLFDSQPPGGLVVFDPTLAAALMRAVDCAQVPLPAQRGAQVGRLMEVR